MKDILALDKGLRAQFDKLEFLAQAEKNAFSRTFPGNDTAKNRGRVLLEIRQQKVKLADELISMLEGYNLDYIIPRHITLPISGKQWQLPKIPRGQGISMGNTTISNKPSVINQSIKELLSGN